MCGKIKVTGENLVKDSYNIIYLFICIYIFFVLIMNLSDICRISPLLCTFFALTSTLLNINYNDILKVSVL